MAMKHTYSKRKKKGKVQSGKQDQHSSKQEEGQSPQPQQASRQASIIAKKEELTAARIKANAIMYCSEV